MVSILLSMLCHRYGRSWYYCIRGTGRLNPSHETKFSGTYGDRGIPIHFPCSADHEQDWQPFPVDPCSAICDYHTYIHTVLYQGTCIVRRIRNPLGVRSTGGNATLVLVLVVIRETDNTIHVSSVYLQQDIHMHCSSAIWVTCLGESSLRAQHKHAPRPYGLKKNLNASRPFEHQPVREKNVKTFRWDHWLQRHNPFMTFNRVPQW